MIIAAALAGVMVLMASVAPVRRPGSGLEFRRRQSLERVHAVLVAEHLMAMPRG